MSPPSRPSKRQPQRQTSPASLPGGRGTGAGDEVNEASREHERGAPVPVELAGYIRRRAARRLQFHVQPELHTATVRALVAARAYEADPEAVERLIEALIDDLLHLTSEVWIVLSILRQEAEQAEAE
jgi:hypothetical protein